MRRKFCLMLVLVLVLGLSGMVSANSDTLVIGSGAEAIGLDPRLETDVPSFERINVIMEPLVKFDVDMNLVPALAIDWEFSDDSLTLTFKLREGVTWHDGKPFTAEDVKYTFDWVLESENAAPNRGLYADVEDIRIINDHEISFHLSKPYSFLLNNIARMPITAKHHGDRDDFRQNPIGTGPYELVSWTRDSTGSHG
jgi:peptide/nickel transport system substrate-binding protein